MREAVGTAEEALTPPADLVTVADLLDWLAARSDGHARALADRGAVRIAIDQVHAKPDSPLGAAAEVAIFPPVTGG